MSCINKKKSKSENSSLRNFAAFNSSSRCYNSCRCTKYVCYINTIPNTTLQVCAFCIETSSNSLLKKAASDWPKTAFYKRQGAQRSSFPLSVVLNTSANHLQNKYKQNRNNHSTISIQNFKEKSSIQSSTYMKDCLPTLRAAHFRLV